MRRCWWVGVPSFVGLVVAAGLIWCHLAATINPIPADEEAARRQVNAALPLDSTRKQVEAWLAARWIGVDHTDGSTGRFVAARTDYVNWRGDSGDVWMEFSFDEQGRLTQSHVYVEIVSL